MTPETLRKFFLRLAQTGWKDGDLEFGYAAADAWEARVADLKLANMKAAELHGEDMERLSASKQARQRAETEVRRLCWIAPEGYNELYCEFCEATAEDGKGQEYLDAQHEPGCYAALAPDDSGGAHHTVDDDGIAPEDNPGFEPWTPHGSADVFASWAEEAGAVGVEKVWRPVRFRQSMICPLCHDPFEAEVTANVRGAAWMADLSAVVPSDTKEDARG